MSLEQSMNELTSAVNQLAAIMSQPTVVSVGQDVQTPVGESIQTGAAEAPAILAAAKPPTKKATSEVAVALGKAKGRDVLATIVKSFGVEKVPELAEDQRADFIIACEKAAAVEDTGGADLVGDPVTTTAYDFDALVAMITTLANGGKTADVVAALSAAGVQKASELKPEQYPTFGAALQAAIGE